jgi:4-amino-4-deoxy-L-arabinose transferase-like glycosyltransferase
MNNNERGVALKKEKALVWVLIPVVLAVRLVFLFLFQRQQFSGPSVQYDLAFVAMNILEGKGFKTFAQPPRVVELSDPSRLIDPENYVIPSDKRLPYIREVPGYSLYLVLLWLLTGSKLWIFAQVGQILFEALAALGLYFLARKFFGPRPALFAILAFAFLFHEARTSVVPYKDVFLLYFMLLIALSASQIYWKKGKPYLWFFLICLLSGAGFYFMTTIILYPFFMILVFLILKRVSLRRAVPFFLMAVIVLTALIYPYTSYVQRHRQEPDVAQPLFWYRFWLGTKVQAFYSTQEERFEGYFQEKIKATGLTLEEICRQEFLDYIKSRPLSYAGQTLKKLLFGTFLVYANAGDATYASSWSNYQSLHPGAGFREYARSKPLRVIGMAAGTLSASLLFPCALIAFFLLSRERKRNEALFFLQIPVYFLLLHMFFHYEARYLLGTLPGYLPLLGYLLSKISRSSREKAASLSLPPSPLIE